VKKIAIMQPYFLPYLGYFDLMNKVDQWVVFDTAQYVKKHWGNRNYIQGYQNDRVIINIPVKQHPVSIPYNKVEVCQPNWIEDLIKNLSVYKKAPYYSKTIDLFQTIYAEGTSQNILSFVNVALQKGIAQYIGIQTPVVLYSEIETNPAFRASTPSLWGVHICKLVKASVIMNRPGGKEILNEEVFKSNGIELVFQEYSSFNYSCGKKVCIPDLSIIDTLMWVHPEAIYEHLYSLKSNYNIVTTK
jgi:hypothetical protein